jgi:predicted dehydrogenase
MSKFTRRRFLEDSMFAAAAAAAATTVPGIMSQKAQAAVSANEKLGVAVVGCRGRGNSHIGAYVGDDRTDVLYIVDPDEKVGQSRCEQVAERQSVKPKFVKDMREAFDDDAVNIVSTATPNHWHALTSVWAMQADKDVYVEKPVCHNIQEGRAMVATARKYDKMCQVGTQCRSNPAIQNAMQFIFDGGIGDVDFARGLCYKRRRSIGDLGDYNIPEEVDFNLWSGPAAYTDPKLTRGQFHYDWHWQRLYGNGDSGNQGPHQTDIARWGLGLQCHPNSVIAYGGRLGYDIERDNPDYVDAGDTANTEIAIYNYGKKTMVFETRGLDTPDLKGAKIGVVFYGTEGYLVQSSYTSCSAFDLDGNKIKDFGGGGNHFGNFLDACQSRNAEDLNADVLEGHYSAALAHLANISYYMGEDNKVSVAEAAEVLKDVKSLDDNIETLNRTVEHFEANGIDLEKTPMSLGPYLEFDPDAEVFTNNDDANELVGREYRESFVCPTADKV